MATRSVIQGLVLAIATLGVAAQESARPQWRALRADQRALVERWLAADCGVGEAATLRQQLTAEGSRLEPALWEAFELGPPPDVVESARRAAERRHGARRAWLRRRGTVVLGEEEAKRQLAITREVYVGSALARLRGGYRSAALAGIGLVGTATAEPRLRQLAQPGQELEVAAREALARLRERLRD